MRFPSLTLRVLGLVCLCVACCTGGAAAQIAAGIQGDWGSETDFGLGARGIVGLGGVVSGLEVVGTFDYFFPAEDQGADLTSWEVNATLAYRFPVRPVTPYAGAGVNLAYFKASVDILGVNISADETTAGINMIGGVLFRAGRVNPFLEGRMVLSDNRQFVIGLGVRFHLIRSAS